MIHHTTELDRVLTGADMQEPGLIADGVDPTLVPTLQRISAGYRRRLSVAVLGRAGVGRDTMARAVRDRLGITALTPGEDAESIAAADLVIYVISGGLRAADRAAVAALPTDQVIVVLGKADSYPDADASEAAAAEMAAELERPVIGVSALLACADVTSQEWAFLGSLAAAGEQMPSMAGQFLVGQVGGVERRTRITLLRRIDRFGIDLALGVLADGGCAVADFNALLHRVSGIDAIRRAIGERIGGVRHRRENDARDALELAAAAGVGRDCAERLLRVGQRDIGAAW